MRGDVTRKRAVLWMLLRCLLLTLIPAITHIMAPYVNIYMMAFVHSLAAFVFLLPWVLWRGVKAVATAKLYLHGLRGMLSAVALVLWTYTLTVMPYVEALSLSFIWAISSVILAALWFSERVTWRVCLALIGGLIGTGIILMPGSRLFQPAALLAIVTVLIWSCTDIIIKTLSVTEHSSTQGFYITLFMTLFTLPLALIHWQWPSANHVMYLFLQGGLFALNMIAVSYAYRAQLCDIMPLDFSRLLFMTAIALFILHESLTIPIIIGSTLILASAIYCVSTVEKT